jgi:predicted nucleic acid-binding protein
VPRIVIDASTAAKWQLSDETDSIPALDMLQDYIAGTIEFVAPRIWSYEIANVMNKAVSIGRLTETEGREAFEILHMLDIEFLDFPSPSDAYRLARTYQRSVYDSLYLTAAHTHNLDFWTGDRRLYNAVVERLSFVRWIGDYPTHGEA